MDAITDPDPRVGLLQAQTRNMRSKCRCSCVLQFTLCHAFSSVLHRPPSQLIHCIVLYSIFLSFFHKERVSTCPLGFNPGEKGVKLAHDPGIGQQPTGAPQPCQPRDRSLLSGRQQTGRQPASSRTRGGPEIPGGGFLKVSRQQSLGL